MDRDQMAINGVAVVVVVVIVAVAEVVGTEGDILVAAAVVDLVVATIEAETTEVVDTAVMVEAEEGAVVEAEVEGDSGGEVVVIEIHYFMTIISNTFVVQSRMILYILT